MAYPMLHKGSWQVRQQEDYFFFELSYQLYLTQESAIYAHKSTRVTPLMSEKKIIFTYYNQHGQRVEENLELPASVALANQMAITFSPGSGTINKISSIAFTTNYQEGKITYQYYIGSGRFVKKKS
ncbi:hypothetical protein [Vagococcus coleopterorum]|nr:hypothetical protein [Vagococcus coleopterorum]